MIKRMAMQASEMKEGPPSSGQLDRRCVTAESFFSHTNKMHPVVKENDTLKKKLVQLNQLRDLRESESKSSLGSIYSIS